MCDFGGETGLRWGLQFGYSCWRIEAWVVRQEMPRILANGGYMCAYANWEEVSGNGFHCCTRGR